MPAAFDRIRKSARDGSGPDRPGELETAHGAADWACGGYTSVARHLGERLLHRRSRHAHAGSFSRAPRFRARVRHGGGADHGVDSVSWDAALRAFAPGGAV